MESVLEHYYIWSRGDRWTVITLGVSRWKQRKKSTLFLSCGETARSKYVAMNVVGTGDFANLVIKCFFAWVYRGRGVAGRRGGAILILAWQEVKQAEKQIGTNGEVRVNEGAVFWDRCSLCSSVLKNLRLPRLPGMWQGKGTLYRIRTLSVERGEAGGVTDDSKKYARGGEGKSVFGLARRPLRPKGEIGAVRAKKIILGATKVQPHGSFKTVKTNHSRL